MIFGSPRVGASGAWLCRAAICLLLFALTLAGCSDAEEPSKRELRVAVPIPDGGLLIPKRYECKERAVWLPIEWSRVPGDTAELILVMSISEMERGGRAVNSSLAGHVVIARLDPSLRRLRVGDLPDGAILKTDRPDLICPPSSNEYGLAFTVYALPEEFHFKRRQAVDLALIETLEESSTASGYALALYGGRRMQARARPGDAAAGALPG